MAKAIRPKRERELFGGGRVQRAAWVIGTVIFLALTATALWLWVRTSSDEGGDVLHGILTARASADGGERACAAEGDSREGIVYHSKKNDRMEIALSFDDGPHPRYTPEILSILAEYGVHATFFMVGENVGYYPDAATAVLEAGHEIGNHTFSHHRLRQMSEGEIREEILACEDAISSVAEYRPRFIRPPEGCMNDGLRQAAAELDYRIVLWDIDTLDWAHTPPATIARHILDEVEAGDIILMHDFIGHNSPTPEALRLVIPALIERGYRLVTVGELIDGDESGVRVSDGGENEGKRG